MTTPDQLAPNATALLTMAAGNPCSIAEFAMYVEQLDYFQRDGDNHRWILNDPENRATEEPAAIVLRDINGPVISMDVFGKGHDHFTNLNYVMQRSGWQSCVVVCLNGDISAKMLARFVGVEVISDHTQLPASSLDANQEQFAPHTDFAQQQSDGASATIHPMTPQAANQETDATDPLEEFEVAGQRVRQLTIQLSAAQQQASSSEDENVMLRTRIRELEACLTASQSKADAAPSSPATGGPSAQGQLMAIIEKYLLPTVEISSAASSTLVKDLRAAGYDVQLRLIKLASL